MYTENYYYYYLLVRVWHEKNSHLHCTTVPSALCPSREAVRWPVIIWKAVIITTLRHLLCIHVLHGHPHQVDKKMGHLD